MIDVQHRLNVVESNPTAMFLVSDYSTLHPWAPVCPTCHNGMVDQQEGNEPQELICARCEEIVYAVLRDDGNRYWLTVSERFFDKK